MSRNYLAIEERLGRINSATQYPSIASYHVVGKRGEATETLAQTFDTPESVYITEKLDGTNARIVIPPKGADSAAYYIGSRIELLTAAGDLVHNPYTGIVRGVRDYADVLVERDTWLRSIDDWIVIFGEVFGGSVQGNQRYGGSKLEPSFRVFDICAFPSEVLDQKREWIASWRDAGRQTWIDFGQLPPLVRLLGLDLVPIIKYGESHQVPTGVAETHAWLKQQLPETRVVLGQTGTGKPEGVVVRTNSRSRIVKIRFEQYEKAEKMARQS